MRGRAGGQNGVRLCGSSVLWRAATLGSGTSAAPTALYARAAARCRADTLAAGRRTCCPPPAVRSAACAPSARTRTSSRKPSTAGGCPCGRRSTGATAPPPLRLRVTRRAAARSPQACQTPLRAGRPAGRETWTAPSRRRLGAPPLALRRPRPRRACLRATGGPRACLAPAQSRRPRRASSSHRGGAVIV